MNLLSKISNSKKYSRFQIHRYGEIQSKIFNFLMLFIFCEHLQLVLRTMLSFLGEKSRISDTIVKFFNIVFWIVSSVRSSNSHPDLLVTHHQHPTFSDLACRPLYETQLQMFQKVEYGWGPIFKVVLECLKRSSKPFLIYIYGIQCDFMPKICWKHSNFENC